MEHNNFTNLDVAALLKKQFNQLGIDESTYIKIIIDLINKDRTNVIRRFQGKTAFSVEDILLICKHFSFSLDELFLKKDEGRLSVKYSYMEPTSHTFGQEIEKRNPYVPKVNLNKDLHLIIATNDLPFNLVNDYSALWLFNLKRTYFYYDNTFPSQTTRSLKEALIKNEGLRKKVTSQFRHFQSMEYIFHEDMMKDLVDEILLLENVGLLDSQLIEEIKDSAYKCLDQLEQTANTQELPQGSNPVDIYICPSRPGDLMIFDSSFFKQFVGTSMHFITVQISDTLLFLKIKRKLEVLKNFSHRITGAGAIERRRFFTNQREELQRLP